MRNEKRKHEDEKQESEPTPSCCCFPADNGIETRGEKTRRREDEETRYAVFCEYIRRQPLAQTQKRAEGRTKKWPKEAKKGQTNTQVYTDAKSNKRSKEKKSYKKTYKNETDRRLSAT
jgi:hypothetical protein